MWHDMSWYGCDMDMMCLIQTWCGILLWCDMKVMCKSLSNHNISPCIATLRYRVICYDLRVICTSLSYHITIICHITSVLDTSYPCHTHIKTYHVTSLLCYITFISKYSATSHITPVSHPYHIYDMHITPISGSGFLFPFVQSCRGY